MLVMSSRLIILNIQNMEVDEQGGWSCGCLLWSARHSGQGGSSIICSVRPMSCLSVVLLVVFPC